MLMLSHPPITWACVTCVVICVCRRGGREHSLNTNSLSFLLVSCANSPSQLIKLKHERRYTHGKKKTKKNEFHNATFCVRTGVKEDDMNSVTKDQG